jgi:2,4-dienoyl-CoA reductase-like NADH-dependent reductase (Old Yellow Enzyme family)
MSSDLKPLYQPFTLGGGSSVQLKNRFIMTALSRSRAIPDFVPNAVNLEYYIQRARGGVGMIIAEGSFTSPQGPQFPYNPGLWNDAQVAGWRKVVDAVHQEGVPIFAQLLHVGRAARKDHPSLGNVPVVAPSAIRNRGGAPFYHIPGAQGCDTPTAIPDPWAVVEEFKKAAANAKAAGFDGVEINAGQGWLLHQFLDSGANVRTDIWGGPIENRARFPLEVIKAALEVFGKGGVGVKLSPAAGQNDTGMPLDETIATFKYFLEQIDQLGLAYICLVRYDPFLDIKIDGEWRGTNHDVLPTYRQFITKTPVMLNAGLQPSEAAEFISSSKVDLAGFGMQWILNPDLAKRLEKGVTLNGFNKLRPDKLYWGKYDATEDEMRVGYTDYEQANL